jgi:tRNA-2-methylthio-N6-dimethylallyladenosine synthase
MKVHLETMGCQMNQLDSELVISSLRAGGYEMVDDPRYADVMLYNTCSVRSHAEQKVLSRIGVDAERKAAGESLIVGVLGCMAQRIGGSLRDRYPAIDLICGPGQLHHLCEMIRQAVAGRPAVALDPSRKEIAAARKTDMPAPLRGGGMAPGVSAAPYGQAANRSEAKIRMDDAAVAPEGMDALDLSRDASAEIGSQAYVRVMRGCDNFCTYCVVPYVRGPECCKEPRLIAEEVRRLVDAGKTEITLLGQTVNSYRWQDGGVTVRFGDLLAMVGATAGLRRLRFVTSHPEGFGDDILLAMRDLPNMCRYIHVPAQSGSDIVLARMNRKYTRAQYDALVDRARAIMPDVVFAGDFIVGFPGETEADHQASVELIRRSGYRQSFIFKYSPRPGTVAAKRFPDDVPTYEKKRRNTELLAMQTEVSQAHHDALIGTTMEVLVDGPSPRSTRKSGKADAAAKVAAGGRADFIQLLGRTRGDHIVVFDGAAGLAGQYVDVRIESATALTLFGVMS